jgi:hypothetical protein
MHEKQPPDIEGSPARAIALAIGGGLRSGRLGVIAARPGVGKTQLLVHLGVDRMLAGDAVLHVALRDSIEHVRAYYDEVVRALGTVGAPARAGLSVERNRMIHSWLDRRVDARGLRSHLEMLATAAGFTPKLLLIDGLDDNLLLPELASLAEDLELPTWASLRITEEPGHLAGADPVIHLFAAGRNLGLELARTGQPRETLPFTLDCPTLLVAGTPAAEPTPVRQVAPADCVLCSGGATGAEAAFGEAAERWGVREVNYTFDGHKQERVQGSQLLSARELASGDVSLAYVSKRLHRTYQAESSLIKRVLQTLWHMVSKSQQVFVVGQIQPDGTVVGGTGWSVELARMWRREVWVFDQQRTAWFRWDGADWTAGTPRIASLHFCGTGTRYLTPEGSAAVAGLFDRSFGPSRE